MIGFIRFVVTAFALSLAAASFVMLGAAVNYNETPLCTEGSVLHLTTGCEPGQKAPWFDPLPQP